MKRNEGKFEKLVDLPKVADSCADQAVVRKVPVYNGVRIVLESGFLEEAASPVTIVHDLFVLCAFHKADVVGVDLKCFVLLLPFCIAIVLTRQIKRRAVKLDPRSPHPWFPCTPTWAPSQALEVQIR